MKVATLKAIFAVDDLLYEARMNDNQGNYEIHQSQWVALMLLKDMGFKYISVAEEEESAKRD